MKHKARYTPRLRTWLYWASGNDWANRTVGIGYTLREAFENWIEQTGAAAVSAAQN